MKMSPVVHFEMAAEDTDRASKFYQEAFGWQMMQMGPEFDGYIIAATTESDEKGPKKPGAINGGLYKRDPKENPPHVVISVENLDESIEAVKAAGGEVAGEKMDIPGVGMFIFIKDTEGNGVGVLQPHDSEAMNR